MSPSVCEVKDDYFRINDMNDEIVRLKLMKELPLFKKGCVYDFEMETGNVYMVEKGKRAEYPLRSGLAGYLWLLRYSKGFFKFVKIL